MTAGSSRRCARRRSPSPIGCSAAQARPRTWCRRASSASTVRERIESPRAYLSTAVSRLSLDYLRSARVRRETYVGEWLPEPLVTSADDDPPARPRWPTRCKTSRSRNAARCSGDRLSSTTRKAIDEPYDRIAEIVGTSEQNARQLAARARRHVEERRPRFQALAAISASSSPETRFFAAAEEGDLGGLEGLLAHDVVFRGDGGGKAPAAARAVYGRARVARLLIAGLRALARLGGVTMRRDELNGQPGALFLDREGRLLRRHGRRHRRRPDPGRERGRRPDKLRHLGAVADPRAAARAQVNVALGARHRSRIREPRTQRRAARLRDCRRASRTSTGARPRGRACCA